MNTVNILKKPSLEQIIEALADEGYVVADDFLDEFTVKSLHKIACEAFKHGEMQAAKTGLHAQHHQLRGDHISWLDALDKRPAVATYLNQMQVLKEALNAALFMNLNHLETHFAVYPMGSGYKKHLDQFNLTHEAQFQARQLSSIVYLNDAWKHEDGGMLRMYLDEKIHDEKTHVDIAPIAGRLVLFLSARFWHEVLPAKRERVSLTGWFRTREPLVF